MMDQSDVKQPRFGAIRVSLASPDEVMGWSHGEVTKPETINYRTLRAEKEGLFDERIFGPTKDLECFCGKYKRLRYKGVICDRCGVEVTRSNVRRERMGHIDLAAPVANIWFSKGAPTRLGLLLDISPRNLERVLYFSQHIIISIDEEQRSQFINHLQSQLDALVKTSEKASKDEIDSAKESPSEPISNHTDAGPDSPNIENEETGKDAAELELELKEKLDAIEDLQPRQLLTETRHRWLKDAFGDVFTDGMGAESVLRILQNINLDDLKTYLTEEMHSTSGQRRKKAIKRLRVVEAFRHSNNKPEWMILTVLPVLPPDLRPLVPLDGGRFATSDLNDLYRRVINRNNRLKRLLELGAPEIIIRNEKRMLQESVDALIDNGRRGRPIQGSHNHKLRSLSDLLRGKQGRFRQNLLGKRVDYSGRSVIVVGPELALNECGLPKRMALELFKPFVMHRLVILGLAPNIKSAKKIVERADPEVWDILEDVTRERPVLLNRAPTLHRLGIQAFQPVLIEGSAIQIHPLVCPAFNADFDGDQMAVHVPLSSLAVQEAKKLMLSTNNMLSPASGEPLTTPTQDIVMGCYYLTKIMEGKDGDGKKFSSESEAKIAYEAGIIDLRARIMLPDNDSTEGWRVTTIGRVIFNNELPDEIAYKNQLMDKPALNELTAECYTTFGNEKTAEILDRIKRLGFTYATSAGITIGMSDIQVSSEKGPIVSKADSKIDELEEQFLTGLITEEERYTRAVDIWTQTNDEITAVVQRDLPSYGGIALMVMSGAKGNISQVKQMAGMRGLMSNPKGRIIDLPIKSSFREGLSVLEYFISTHGARKGLADTALRTADSGYLTRRLVDICQDVIILEDDCGTDIGIQIVESIDDPLVPSMVERSIGRLASSTIPHPETGEILVDKNEIIDANAIRKLSDAGVKTTNIRSPLTCESKRGLCASCYGLVPATGKKVIIGEAVGIIAAQSIGEPGTQLTMRTFHTGGVAGADITSGLPRVEELFEARIPKGAAILADIDGIVEITEDDEISKIRVVSSEIFEEEYMIPKGYKAAVKNGAKVDTGTVLAKKSRVSMRKGAVVPREVVADVGGTAKVTKQNIVISWEEKEEQEHVLPATVPSLVDNGSRVQAGQGLTAGHLNPHDILRIKGKEEVEKYIIDEVQKVYRSQGVTIHDKHIEIIARQMLRRVQIDTLGDTEFIPGDFVDRFYFQDNNAAILAEGGEPATAKPALLSVTRASLLTSSFLAAASFQETTRVLSDASVKGARDNLLGLKENVIIGRLIPARIDVTEEGKERLGLPELEEAAVKAAESLLLLQRDAPSEPEIDDSILAA